MKILFVLPLAFLLVACNGNDEIASTSLPPVPTDIKMCFRAAVDDIPKGRDLTQAEVESLWKIERVRNKVMRQCGNRILAWYGQLRAGWK